jgi:hypothetical protein
MWHPILRIHINIYNPLSANAKLPKIVFSSVTTPASTTFSTACTVRIKSDSDDVNGVVKITSTPSPSTKIAAPTVAKISTMIRDRSAATAMSWRFSSLGDSMRSVETESMEDSRDRLVAFTWGRAAISLVVEVMAAVMRLI